MKYYFFFCLFVYTLISCSDGKLDYRKSCPDYPFNGWKFTFTIKKIKKDQWDISSMKNSYKTSIDISTDTYTLNPGEEVYLTCSDIVQARDNKTIAKYEFEVVGELEEK